MDTHEKVMDLALRRGFLWPSYEIYGGASGFYDFGPLGATMKKKLEDKWREYYCIREGFLEISSPAVAPEEIFIASGHVSSFVDPMVECTKCKEVYKATDLIKEALGIKVDGLSYKELEELIKKNGVRCPGCRGELSEVWSFNLMFKTHIGPGSKKVGYLRPETAQAMFMLFNRLYGFYRKKLPFGVAQLGRVYRNEISPRQGVIRLREFSQAEVEIFVNPKEKMHKDFRKYANEELRLVPGDGREIRLSARDAVRKKIIAHELLAYHLVLVKKFLEEVGIPREKLQFRQHLKTEMAHYAAECWDAEVLTKRFGYIEVVGIADRTDYDLKAHMKRSGADLSAFLQFEEPREIEKKIVEANLARLGSKFKEKTSEIIKVIKNLGEREIESFEKKGDIDLKIDGENIRLDRNYLTAKKVRERLTGEKIIPHVIEPSYGTDRIIYCVLESAYRENGERKILSLKNSVAPIEAAVFPLIAKEELTIPALEIYENLKNQNFFCIYDEADSIGRRYARVDEIGVPYAVTVDFDGLKDGTVTIRERDTTEQRRIKIKEIPKILRNLLEGKVGFKAL